MQDGGQAHLQGKVTAGQRSVASAVFSCWHFHMLKQNASLGRDHCPLPVKATRAHQSWSHLLPLAVNRRQQPKVRDLGSTPGPPCTACTATWRCGCWAAGGGGSGTTVAPRATFCCEHHILGLHARKKTGMRAKVGLACLDKQAKTGQEHRKDHPIIIPSPFQAQKRPPP